MSIVELKNPLTPKYQELKMIVLGNNFPWFWDTQADGRSPV